MTIENSNPQTCAIQSPRQVRGVFAAIGVGSRTLGLLEVVFKRFTSNRSPIPPLFWILQGHSECASAEAEHVLEASALTVG